jgi:aminocarboxymuconate-semialdehyde decarboxylase
VNGVSVGDARIEPFFAAVEKMGAAVFVHALRPAGQDRIVGGVAEQVICFPGDIGLAAASMITGGIAERHPKLRVAFSHGGGVFSFLVPRMTRAWEVTPKLRESIVQAPGVYAKRFYYDTIVFDPAALRHIIHSFGASQIVVGSDYPFNLGDPDPMGTINRAGIDAATVRAIAYENAERFLERKLVGQAR